MPKLGNYETRALPQLAWQVSAVPAQLLGLHGAERRGLPFFAALGGSAALGLVDWPVALLIAGGYLLTSRPAGRSSPADTLPVPAATPAATPIPLRALHDAAASGGTPAAQPLAGSQPAAADRLPVQVISAEPEPSAPPADAGHPLDPPDAASQRQQDQPAPGLGSVEQPSPQPATSPAVAQPGRSQAPANARQQRRSRPAGDDRRSAATAAAPREPWPGYDQMTVPRVLARLDESDVDLAAIERYEQAHRDRKTVRAAVTSRLSARPS